jgi:hypothetical protein
MGLCESSCTLCITYITYGFTSLALSIRDLVGWTAPATSVYQSGGTIGRELSGFGHELIVPSYVRDCDRCG